MTRRRLQLASSAAEVGPPARRLKVALVGPIQQENLALAYIAGAVRKAGHEATIIAFGDRTELESALAAVLAAAPDLVGLGIAFQNNVADYVEFLRALRDRGFRGHMTAGGHVPTFCHEELLRDVPGLDTVVRHEGEETMIEMLALLARGEPVRDVAGLVWREGGGTRSGPVRRPIVDLDSIPVPERSPDPYFVGGIPVEFLITARGCVGECHYCSIAAFTSEIGVPFRLRKPVPVADEIANLHHARGGRVFFVQDDLFVLPSERKTVERVDAISEALAARGVRDVVFWLKGRPETITRAVCEALVRMGTIHVFLGVENASAARLAYLGRTHRPSDNESALAR
ncbi:MAG TPA: cobalamin-dependent protein, partial [Polyangiaceae bacterium]|nr:cobalamin-dependent protein [Polyangiaceae bacterium]